MTVDWRNEVAFQCAEHGCPWFTSDPSGRCTEHRGDVEEAELLRAARWLGQTHHHDWGLLDAEGRERRVEEIVQQFRPFVEALLHINIDDRMAVLGMVQVPCSQEALPRRVTIDKGVKLVDHCVCQVVACGFHARDAEAAGRPKVWQVKP